MLTWASSWWLFGLAGAVAAPLLVHLLSQRGGQTAEFTTIRFLEQAAADIARIQRPRHWLLMLLRIAAIALIVAAFAEPRWLSEAAITHDHGVCVAIVIDSSASMQRTSGGATLFDEARRQVSIMLETLDPTRDTAVIILAGASPQSLLTEPSANFTQLLTNLDATDDSFERGDLDSAIDLALNIARKRAHGEVRVELFTDAQQTVFPHDAIARCKRERIAVNIHTLGQFESNTALHDVRLFPSQPIVHQPARVHGRVTNFGDEPRMVNVRLGQQVRSLRLEAWRSAEVIFNIMFDQPGPAAVELTLETDDALDSDNVGGRVVQVAAARPVTLITSQDIADPRTAAYFTARALTPSRDGVAEGVALTIIKPSQLTAASSPLEPQASNLKPSVWVIVEAGTIDKRSLAVMDDHLQTGGGIVWVIDSHDAAMSLVSWPGAPIIDTQWSDEANLQLAIGRFDDPILEVFEGPGRSALLNPAFRRGMIGRIAPHAQPLLLSEDGSPVLSVAWYGAGRCAVWAVDLAPTSTSLVKSPTWPALLHQLLRHLAPGPGSWARLHPGDVLPDGTLATHTGLTRTPAGDVYVQLDLDESDLRTTGTESSPDEPIHNASHTSVPLRPVTHELWPMLILAALGILAIETAVVWQLSRGRGVHVV